MCIENVKHYVENTWQIGKTYLPLKKRWNAKMYPPHRHVDSTVNVMHETLQKVEFA